MKKPSKAAKKKPSLKPAASPEALGESSLEALLPRLRKLPKVGLASTSFDIEAASIVALGVAQRIGAPKVRARFVAIAQTGELSLAHVDDLASLAWATRYARGLATAAIAHTSRTKVPVAITNEASVVEKRMQTACEHTLKGIPEAVATMDLLRPGRDYRDLAGDLEGYAALYEQYPAQVKLDGINFRDGDAKRAHELAQEIVVELGKGLSRDAKDSLDVLARAWTLLLEVYAEVAAAGRFLFRNDEPDTLFPSLYAAGRPSGGRPKKAAAKGSVKTPANGATQAAT